MSGETNSVEDDIVETLTGYFREGLTEFLAKGDRAEMIHYAAWVCQKMDQPEQDRIRQIYLQNRATLARHDL